MRKPLIFFIYLLTAVNSFCQTPAQSRSDLEKEREAIQKEIEDVKRSLDETKKNKKETLGQLALLQRRLRLRQMAIQNINGQINLIQSDMSQSYQEILKLKKELDTLRKQYAESVVYSYENRTNYDFLNFIFAATSFNDAVKRIAYLKSYRSYRTERADNIKRTQDLLQGKIDGLTLKRKEKDEVLQKQTKERQELEIEKREKDVVVNKLQSQEKELKKEMSAKQKQDQKLGSAIAAAIRRARDEAIKEAKRKDAATKAAEEKASVNNKTNTPANNNAVTTTPAKPKNLTVFSSNADVALSDNFEKNQRHLPWPVDAGNISMAFGPHEYIKGVKHNNPGITIETNGGSTVKAVFEGEVQSVFNVADVSAVMIRHGKYFTTYSNLASVSVSKGQQVRTGQSIGKLADAGELEFILSDDKNRNLDPQLWLRR
ncbi:MAG: peptidoglycan DD-metalloendopeptidase family protein [Bacteroidetes bacterium]|nr:peptidoglycan DD-metalloendopeptidase family protein [Bacteroidota bacterium]